MPAVVCGCVCCCTWMHQPKCHQSLIIYARYDILCSGIPRTQKLTKGCCFLPFPPLLTIQSFSKFAQVIYEIRSKVRIYITALRGVSRWLLPGILPFLIILSHRFISLVSHEMTGISCLRFYLRSVPRSILRAS